MNTPLSAFSTDASAQVAPTVLLSGVDTDDVFTLVTDTLPPYEPGTPLHTHPQHAEGCYVLAGTLAVTQSEQTITLRAGTAVRVPAGVLHTYWNPSAEPTVILLIYTPGAPADVADSLAAGRPGLASPPFDTS